MDSYLFINILISKMSTSLYNMSICCPITHQIFNEPVVAVDGHTYEKDAIIEWMKNSVKSPITNKELSNNFVTNYAIISIIDSIITKNPSLIKNQYIKKRAAPISAIFVNPFEYNLFDWKVIIDIFDHKKLQRLFSNEKIVCHILNNSVNIDYTLTNKWSLLCYACKFATPAVTKCLINNLIENNVPNWRFNSGSCNSKPIVLACQYSTIEIIEKLSSQV